MELRVLEYFLAVAREETISKAAKYLHITQPTLSRQLKELEDEIGKTLFIRGNRKITLTDEGILLRKRAEEILTLVEKTEADLMADSDRISGEITIGGGETQGMRYVIKVIDRINKRYPDIRFHLYSGNATDVMERIDKGLIEFGLVIGDVDLSKYDSMTIPYKDTWGLLMKDDDILSKKESITIDDLKGIPLIVSHQVDIQSLFNHLFHEDSTDLNIRATYNLVYNASLMVEEGCGYCLCLEGLVDTKGSRHLTFVPLATDMKEKIRLIQKKYTVLSKAAAVFINTLKERG